MNLFWTLLVTIIIFNGSSLQASSMMAADLPSEQYPSQQGKRKPGFFRTTIPLHDLDIVLGRPTASSVTMSLMASQHSSGLIKYGAGPKKLDTQLSLELAAHDPKEIEISDLASNTTYHCELHLRNEGNDSLVRTGSFSTQRAAHSAFSFAVQADSHLDQNTDTEIYRHTLENIKKARPDFLIDLGDTFMTDKYRQAEEYGYHQGTILGGSGYIAVNVSGDEATVSFMKTVGDNYRSSTSNNSYSYKIIAE